MEVVTTVLDSSFSADHWSRMMHALPQPLRHGAAKYRFDADQQRHILGRLLLFRAFEARGFDWRDVHASISYDRHRRPQLKDIPGDFNISHSGSMIICALTNQGSVGTDVERIRDVKLSEFKRTMNHQQWQTIFDADEPLRKFFQYWAIKESIIKADGRGLQMRLADIFIDRRQAQYEGQQWSYQLLSLGDQYCSAVAGDIPPEGVKVSAVNPPELWNRWL